jgi:hypothetical protein
MSIALAWSEFKARHATTDADVCSENRPATGRLSYGRGAAGPWTRVRQETAQPSGH